MAPEGVILTPDNADILVGNLGQLAVLSIDPTTGDRSVVSGCSDFDEDLITCAGSVTGGGLDFLGPRFLAFENGPGPDLLVSDRSEAILGGAVVRVDPANGDRTIVSGCNNSTCTAKRGAGTDFDQPAGIDVENDSKIIVGDSFGLIRVEYVPDDWLVELKSLKYYFLSWRHIGAAQEDITALVYEDLRKHLGNPDYLLVTTIYNVRGGINTTCTVDSRTQYES